MLAEASEIPRSSATGMDAGRHSAGVSELFGIYAERRAAPINVSVQIDQARYDDKTANIAHVHCGVRRQVYADLGDLAGGECDIHNAVEALRGVENSPALQDEVK